MQAETVQKKIEVVRQELAATGEVLRGSINKVILGKRKRKAGDRIAYQLTYKAKGNVTQTVYVPIAQVARVKAMIRNHRKAKMALDNLVALNVLRLKSENASR